MAKNTVTKRELCNAVAQKHDIIQSDAKNIIQSFLDQIIEEISAGNRLELRDFGVFEPKIRAGRNARNPNTNQPVKVAPKTVVGFKSGKKMSERAQEAFNEL